MLVQLFTAKYSKYFLFLELEDIVKAMLNMLWNMYLYINKNFDS